MNVTFWLELVLFVVLLGFSGFFSSSETALFSLSSLQREQMRRDGHPRIGLIERMLSRPRRLIITILIGNELVNVSASVISAAVVIDLLGAENKWLNLFIMVPILLLVGEITPKTLAIRNNVAFANVESRPIELFARLIQPVRWVVRSVADGIITLIVGKERSPGNIITEDMVRTLAREAVGEGTLDRAEAQFIDHIFDFGNKTLEEVMTPRSNIFFLPVDTPLSEVVTALHHTRHTKIPVYREHRDTVVGILHARDLLGVDVVEMTQVEEGLEILLREPYFVPESKPASELFHDFRERKVSLALTVDEYGGVTGLVTMEDLLECIFGAIPSPSDLRQQPRIENAEGGGYVLEGSTLIADLNRTLNSTLSNTGSATVGGLLLHQHGELPQEGVTIVLKGLRFTVAEVGNNRIEKVHVEKVPPTDPAGQRQDGNERETPEGDAVSDAESPPEA